MQTTRKYQVALSFAGEDRPYVDRVATALRTAGIAVFYDAYEEASLWGKDLYDHLSRVYADEAEFTVMFVSRAYAQKLWTNHERQTAQSRAFGERREYILPARFDDTPVPGLLKTTGYVDLRQKTPEEFADLVAQKVSDVSTTFRPAMGRKPFSGFGRYPALESAWSYARTLLPTLIVVGLMAIVLPRYLRTYFTGSSGRERPPSRNVHSTSLSANAVMSDQRELGGSESSAIYPDVLEGKKTTELGSLLLLLLPKTGERIDWDYRADSNLPIVWQTEGVEVSRGDSSVRRGVVRVNVQGSVATILRQRKQELGWTVTYWTSLPPKFGPEEIEIEPGAGRGGQCFGTLFSGCEFDPRPSFASAGLRVESACEVSIYTESVQAFSVSYPGRRPTTLVWSTSGGSGGISSSISLKTAETYTPETACAKARQEFK